MAKVYLLNPPFIPGFIRCARWQSIGKGGTLYYPIFLSYATGLLEKAGHEVRLVDAVARNASLSWVVKDIRQFNPDLIVIETSFTSLQNDLNIADKIKEVYPEAKIAITGPPASVLLDKIFKHKSVDYVAYYEYEWTIAELACSLERDNNIENIKGLAYRREEKYVKNPPRRLSTRKDLDGLVFVSQIYARHLNIYDYYYSSALYPEVQILAERGCPYRCTFCAWPQTFTGRLFRSRSVGNVIEELAWIKQNLNFVKEVIFEDDTFGVDKNWLHQFLTTLIKEKLDITWSCQTRANLDFRTLSLMRKAGCRLIIVGFESANQQILNNIRKGITVEQMRKFAKNVKKAGILLHTDFIIGLPGETKETIKQTFQFIKEIKPDILQVSVATPFPGTEFYKWSRKNGYLVTDDPNEYLDEQGHQKSIVSYPWLSAEEIERSVDEILRDYYLSASYIPVALKQIFRKNCLNEFSRLLRSAKAFIKYVYR